MYVIKRNGHKEPMKFDKITSRIEKLLQGIDNIDPVVITQKICNRIHTGITTTELDTMAAQLCYSMILEHPNYSTLAARISISNHQKNTSNDILEVSYDLIDNKNDRGDNAPLISSWYYNLVTEHSEFIQKTIDYERDYLLDYFSFKTLERSYLLKVNTGDGKTRIVERPQHLFMRVALALHKDNLEAVKKTYDNISLKNYIHATPTLFNAGTNHPQMSSCFLTVVEDSIEGILDSYKECAIISKWAGGIGCDISKIRSKGSYIKGTGGKSDGIVPLLRTYNMIARQFNQGGKRLGSFAMYIAPWHADIFEFLDAKKNIGDENERARDLFYALWISDHFMDCVSSAKDWYLMDPSVSTGLSDVYGVEFKELYEKYVFEGKYVRKVNSRDIWTKIIAAQVETGTPYILYKDAINKKSNQKNIGVIRSSNLCSEITEVSNPEETAVCNLASICLQNMLEHCDTRNKDKETRWVYGLSAKRELQYRSLKTGEIKILSRDDCTYCKLLKALLNKVGFKYTLIEMKEAKELLLKSKNTDVIETYPQLFVESYDGQNVYHYGGYTDVWEILKPHFNYAKLRNIAAELVVNLNSIIDDNYYPNDKTKRSNARHRPIGIGVQGLADLFCMLKIPFSSDEAMEMNKLIFETIYRGALEGSLCEAIANGPYETFEGSPLSKGQFQFDMWGVTPSDRYDWDDLRNKIKFHGVRNSLLISLMPTATTSQIMTSNESFEPFTSNLYVRRTLAGEFTIVNKYLVDDLIALGLWTQDTRDRIMYDSGSVQNIKGFPTFLKDVYKTVWEISQKTLIDMSADRGPFVCQSQSMNLYFDKPSFSKLYSAHFHGWIRGLKTGSYYIRSKAAKNAQNFGMDAKKEKQLEEQTNIEPCESCSA